ncbi:hypothetical protein NMG46_10050 [Mesorhizobium sp. LMG 17147]|uniref:hypothetical protein n=1 Tax=Mesorhizobium sp. LMG 17147 TaxID=2963091 RepID=UPI0020C957C4|nr:hypothetical protein [Mesorhizobium sp. LMG 17147]MCP9230586.1 hypothetical protein [Mesorhizobium sp. LMG 17147]
MQSKCFVVGIIALSAFFSGQCIAADVCREAAGRSDQAVREQYQRTIDYYIKLAAAARMKGFDPENFPQSDQNGNVETVNFVEIINDLSSQRDQAISEIYGGFQDCEQGFQPAQDIIDTGEFYLSGGLTEILPDQVTHIDASRLLRGTPFGGPNALLPRARDQILISLGIGGDLANIIRNPLEIRPGGPVRLPWNPILNIPNLPLPNVQLPNFPPLPNAHLPNLPPLPPLPSPPPPVQLGTVGGHRVCVPWC